MVRVYCAAGINYVGYHYYSTVADHARLTLFCTEGGFIRESRENRALIMKAY